MKGLMMLERRCLTLKEEVEYSSERQEVLTDLMESKMNMHKTAPEKYQEKIFEELKELEEQRAKEALAQRKHKLVKWEGEMERARTTPRLEASSAIGPWSGGHDNSSFGSCSSSLAFNTVEAMSASSKMAQDADDVRIFLDCSGKGQGKRLVEH